MRERGASAICSSFCTALCALVLWSPLAVHADQTRTFSLGFTDFPHARSWEAFLAAFETIATEGDLAVMHFDTGVPWQEALLGAPYPAAVRADIEAKVEAIPPGHHVYLAITPINNEHDALARYWGDAPRASLPPPWNDRSFDDPAVVLAFIQHALRMIEAFQPDWFAYSIEANALFEAAPEKWGAYWRLATQVYAAVKTQHPDLPTFVTLQADFFASNPGPESAALEPLLPFTDLIAVSSYPFFDDPDPKRVPKDHLTALRALAPRKPFAVAETGWPAEDVTVPFPELVPADPPDQKEWVEHVLDAADRADAVFVNWFFSRDFDEFWQTDLQFVSSAALVRAWKDNGMLAGNGAPRPALSSWRRVAERRLVPEPSAGWLQAAALGALLAMRAARARTRRPADRDRSRGRALRSGTPPAARTGC